MGALDKRIFSGVAIVSALLFVVSAVMLLANGGEVTDAGNDAALYIVTVAGVLTIVYGVSLMLDRSSFVRMTSGVLAIVSGVMFLAVPFAGGSTGVLLAAASIVAAVTIVADMLALWVSRIYGAMYVAAVLAAVDLAMGVLYFAGSSQITYHSITLIAFGVWLALSAYVSGFVKVEQITKTREVKQDKQASKASKPQAKNTKATKKAKKPEKKPEAPKEEPKEVPKEAPKKEEPKAAPVEAPVEQKKEEPKAADNADGQKPPAKSMNDFMKKLMSSENANRAKHEAPKEEPKPAEPAPVAASAAVEPEPEPEAPVETEHVPAPEEPVVEEGEVVIEEPIAEEPEVQESEPTEVPEEEETVEETVIEEAAVEDEAFVETVIETEQAEVPEEAAPEESVEVVSEESEPEPEEAAVDEETVAEPVSETEQAEEPAVIPDESEPESAVPEPVEEQVPEEAVPEEPEPEEPVEDEVEAQPDWSLVSHDASQAEEQPIEEEPVAEEPAEVVSEEPEPEPVVEEGEVLMEEPIVDEPEQPAQEPADVPDAPEQAEGQIQPAEPVDSTVTGETDVETGVTVETGEEELGEDLYTDYSPEAVVRRAAWNKGLRCRRGYGPYQIPVAFVKGKVAVFVDDGEADTSIDAKLKDEGWTVLRYDASKVTDGKAQGEEIAAAVKSNLRSAKAAAKKKSKK